MSKTICSKCRYAIQDVSEMFCMYRKLHTNDGLFVNCHCFSKKSLFHHLTQSPEVLAEKLVYSFPFVDREGQVIIAWYSSIEDGRWFTKAEAITATLEKLKEVEDAEN